MKTVYQNTDSLSVFGAVPAEPQISLGKTVFSNGFHLVGRRPGHCSLTVTLPEDHSRFSDIAVPDGHARSPATRPQVTTAIASTTMGILQYHLSNAASRSTALLSYQLRHSPVPHTPQTVPAPATRTAVFGAPISQIPAPQHHSQLPIASQAPPRSAVCQNARPALPQTWHHCHACPDTR